MSCLLTETERGVLARENDPSRNYVQTVRSRVRDRIRELMTDIEILAEHEPELLDELHRVLQTVDEHRRV